MHNKTINNYHSTDIINKQVNLELLLRIKALAAFKRNDQSLKIFKRVNLVISIPTNTRKDYVTRRKMKEQKGWSLKVARERHEIDQR